MLDSPITIPAEAAEAFASRELPLLASIFSIEGNVAPTNPDDSPTPKFALHVEGSLNFLTAKVEAIYGERRVILDASGAALARFARNRALEQ